MPQRPIESHFTWDLGPDAADLTFDLVHVWSVVLDQPDEVCRRLRAWLSPDECQRADRYRGPSLGRRFVVGRGALRDVLSRYIGTGPEVIRFATGPFGKPAIDLPHAPIGLRFNLSHSHGLGVIAVGMGRELGIDVEILRSFENMDAIAGRFFAPAERAAYAAQPIGQRPLAFFRAWTRKEAYLKAIGSGITVPLDSFEVSVAPEEPPALRVVRGNPDEASRWSMREFRPETSALATLAVEGRGWTLQCFAYAPPTLD
jgi:4'-phosphopantetheinyl transferase